MERRAPITATACAPGTTFIFSFNGSRNLPLMPFCLYGLELCKSALRRPTTPGSAD